jgi:cob(I)alamin adenosyltransferase
MRSLGEIDLDERAAIIAVIRDEIAAEGSRTAFRRCLERALAKLELGPAVSPNATARTTTKVLTLAEVADRFHLKVPWLREFIRKNDIPVCAAPS